MTICAGCRVRHLKCDTHIPCTECQKSGRACVRLNVRFRHLVCPSDKATAAESRKYEFCFDSEQTWIDTSGELEFVAESDISAEPSPAYQLENSKFYDVGHDAETQQAPVDQMPSTFIHTSISDTPTTLATIPDDYPPDYLAAVEQASYDSPADVFLGDASESATQSYQGPSNPREEHLSDMGRVSPGGVLHTQQLAWPLKSLQEASLFQHFITHIAPWVCMNADAVSLD